VDGLGAFQAHAVDLVLGDGDEFALGDLVALDQVLALDRFVGARIERLHPDAVAGLRIDKIESYFTARRNRVVKRDGTRHQRQLKMALPRGTRSHLKTPCTRNNVLLSQ